MLSYRINALERIQFMTRRHRSQQGVSGVGTCYNYTQWLVHKIFSPDFHDFLLCWLGIFNIQREMFPSKDLKIFRLNWRWQLPSVHLVLLGTINKREKVVFGPGSLGEIEWVAKWEHKGVWLEPSWSQYVYIVKINGRVLQSKTDWTSRVQILQEWRFQWETQKPEVLAEGNINHGSASCIFFSCCVIYIFIYLHNVLLFFFLFPQIVNFDVLYLYCRIWDDNLIEILNKL